MLKIGEFAGLTGLSVKALRHYDEAGVLVPAEVDGRTGYRLYADGQVRAGMVIRALRDAGVPLPEVADVVGGGKALEVLEQHRLRVLKEREREDLAFRDAEGVLRALAVVVDVTERTMPAQHFVGQVLAVPVDDVDAVSDEDANEIFGALFTRLQRAGLGPSGPFWTALRAGDQGTIEIACCWPTPEDVPEDMLGSESFAAVLPARTELVATWRPAGGEELPDGILHPAVVGLFDAVDELGFEMGAVEIRQTVTGQSADDFVVELSVTVS
ncbi:MerR family DNA-binding transcriptional regulator [Microbacterium sp. NPDC055357]